MEVVTLNPEYKKILVTGGAGFIGSHLCEEALKQGSKVVCLDDFSNANMETIMPFMSNKNFTLVKGNVCNILDDEKLLQLFKGVDLVFHEACSRFSVCIEDPALDLRINAWGTFNVLEASRRANVKKVVHASTGSVYGDIVQKPATEEHPLHPCAYYGVSKLAGERYCEVFRNIYGLRYTVLRYFNVYGSRQKIDSNGGAAVPMFISRVYNNLPITLHGDGTQSRPFTYVKDIVNMNFICANNSDTDGQVFNCCSCAPVSIKEVAETIKHYLNKDDLEFEYGPFRLGDVMSYDVSNEKSKKLGMSYRTDFKRVLESVIDEYLLTF